MKVPLQGISISQLSDGFAGRAIDKALGEVCRDIDDRGSDGKARKVVITLTLTPERQKGHVEIDTQVQTKMPAFRPPTTKGKLDDRAGALVFNPDCSENPDQLTTNDIDLGEKE
jgi:hypothetical protein